MTFRQLACQSLMLSLLATAAHGQHLFGNPSCSDWPSMSHQDKTTWLKAYLVPLNMTNVARKKPRVDKFSQLSSLDTAVVHVNQYCASNHGEFASRGAIQFLDELTADSPNR